MPNVKSAKKRVRTSNLQRIRNRASRSALKTSMKKLLTSTDPQEAVQRLQGTISLIDKYARQGIIHRNNAARKKARLMAHISRLGS